MDCLLMFSLFHYNSTLVDSVYIQSRSAARNINQDHRPIPIHLLIVLLVCFALNRSTSEKDKSKKNKRAFFPTRMPSCFSAIRRLNIRLVLRKINSLAFGVAFFLNSLKRIFYIEDSGRLRIRYY